MLTLKEMIQYGDDLVDEIAELEDEITYHDYGSYAYDQLDMEIHDRSLKLDKLMKEITETYGEAHTFSFLTEILRSTPNA